MNYDQIGDFLEHQGLTDEQIDDYFEHHGTKGQKWGVRKQKRLETTQRVAAGKGSFKDKAKVLGNQSVVSLIRGHGLTGAAKNQASALKMLKKRTLAGKATTRDMLNNIGSLQFFNTGGSGKKKVSISKEHTNKVDKGSAFTKAHMKGAGNILAGALTGAAVGNVIGKVAVSVMGG